MTTSGEEVATLTAQAIAGSDFFSTPSLGDDFDFLNGYGGNGGTNGSGPNGQPYQYGGQMAQGQYGHGMDHQQQYQQTNQPHQNYYAQPQPNQYQNQHQSQDRHPGPMSHQQQQYFSPPVSTGSPLSNSSDQFDSGFDSPPMMSNHGQYHGFNGQQQQQMQYYQPGAGYGQVPPPPQHHYAAQAMPGGPQPTSTTTNVLNSPLSSSNTSSSSTCGDPFESSGSDSPHSNHYGHYPAPVGHPQHHGQQFHYVNGVGAAGGGMYTHHGGLPPMTGGNQPQQQQQAHQGMVDNRKPGGGKKASSVTSSSPAIIAKRDKKPGKKRRDPNEPQKPVSAYALFFRDTQATIKGGNPNASFGEVSKIVASMWDSLDPNAKFNYKKKTEQAKKEYLKALAAYRASLLNSNSTSPPGSGAGSGGHSQLASSPTSNAVRASVPQQPSPLQKRSPLLTSALQVKRDEGSPVAGVTPMTPLMAGASNPTMVNPQQHQYQPPMSSPGHHHQQPLSVQVPPQPGQQQSMPPMSSSPFGSSLRPGPQMNQHQPPSAWPPGQMVWTSNGSGD